MRCSYFLIPLIILHQKSSADLISKGLGFSLAISTAIITAQAGRAAFHAYSGKKGPLRYKPELVRLIVEETPETFYAEPEVVYATSEFFAGSAAFALAATVDIFDVKPPFNSIDTLLIAPIVATSLLSGPFKDELSGKQEAICFLSACAIHWTLWKVMKRSAEWYAHKHSVASPQQLVPPEPAPAVPVPPAKQEVSLQNLQAEALFSAVLEDKARTWYAKLDSKNYEQCPICFDSIQPSNLHITRCEQPKAYSVHYYHTECINDWKSKQHTDCPTCRGTMLGFRMPPSFVAAATKPCTLISRIAGWIKGH